MPHRRRIKRFTHRLMTTIFTLLEVLGVPRVPKRHEEGRGGPR